MANMWTCIAFTCSDPQWAQALREELIIFQKQNLLRSSLQCFVLEDPAGTVGSGGATLNALLVTVERLCNLSGHTTVTITSSQTLDWITWKFFSFRSQQMFWKTHTSWSFIMGETPVTGPMGKLSYQLPRQEKMNPDCKPNWKELSAFARK